MNSSTLEAVFIETLNNPTHPIILFLGQDLWRREMGCDPILDAIARQLGLDQSVLAKLGYSELISDNAKQRIVEAFYTWLDNIYRHNLAPSDFDQITRLPWNAVTTSSFDPMVPEFFRRAGRTIHHVDDADNLPRSLLNTKRLNCISIFGSTAHPSYLHENLMDNDNLDDFSFQAAELLRNLIHALGAAGLIIIDGYDPDWDCLPASKIKELIKLMKNRVIWFGLNDDKMQTLAKCGLDKAISKCGVCRLPMSLARWIEEKSTQGVIPDSFNFNTSTSKTITLKNADNSIKVIEVQSDYLVPLGNSIETLTDSYQAFLNPLAFNDSEKVEAFTEFHSFPSNLENLFRGISNGFSIERAAESQCLGKITEAIENHTTKKGPLVITGANAVGKTVLVGRLTSEILRQKKCPILYSYNSHTLPAKEPLLNICRFFEEEGANCTLIVIDTQKNAKDIINIFEYLRTRGRRVVMLVTAYQSRNKLIELNNTLTSPEYNSLKSITSQHAHIDLDDLIKRLNARYNTIKITNESNRFQFNNRTIFPIFYNMMPYARQILSAGYIRYFEYAIAGLDFSGGRASNEKTVTKTLMQHKLEDLGLSSSASQDNGYLVGDTEISASLKEAISAIMLCGQWKCAVPANLVFRLITQDGHISLLDVIQQLKAVNLVTWQQAQYNDDFWLAPMHTLEAEVFCNNEFGGDLKREWDFFENILLKLDIYRNEEKSFLLDIAKALCPGDINKSALKYKSYWKNMADAIGHIIDDSSTLDSSAKADLMLQQSRLLRKWAISVSIDHVKDELYASHENVIEALEKAVQVLLEAIQKVDQRSNTYDSILTEQAAAYSTLAIQKFNTMDYSETLELYNRSKEIATLVTLRSETMYPLNIKVWTIYNLLDAGDFQPETIAVFQADACDLLSEFNLTTLIRDHSEDTNQDAYIIGKFGKIFQRLRDDKHYDAVMAVMAEKYPAKYHLAKVLEEYKGLFESKLETHEMRQQAGVTAGAAADQLLNSDKAVLKDPSCLKYLIRCLWLKTTGHFMATDGNRQPLPLKNDPDTMRLKDYLSDLLQVSESKVRFIWRYAMAALYWQDENYSRAKNIWDSLQSDNDRATSPFFQHHLIMETKDKPMLFRGKIKGGIPDGFGLKKVLVAGFPAETQVRISRRDIIDRGLQDGVDIADEFQIAFNYYGPIIHFPRGSE